MSVMACAACSDAPEPGEEKWPNGRLKARGRWAQTSDGQRVRIGPWTFWYAIGQKKAEGEYENGREDGKNDDLGIPMDGQRGSWTGWYESGQKEAEGAYKDGATECWVEWDDKEVPCDKFLADNSVAEVYRRDLVKDAKRVPSVGRDGRWTLWHENGQKKSEGAFKAGKMEGLYTRWHENGQKKQESTIKASKEGESATYAYWDENGQKTLEIHFKDGKAVERIVFKDGKPVEK